MQTGYNENTAVFMLNETEKRFSDPTELHESFKTVLSAGVVEWEVRGIHTMG